MAARLHAGRALRLAAWPAALAFGLAAEVAGRPDALLLDAVAGFALLGFGLALVSRGSHRGADVLLVAAGVAWFAGSLSPDAVHLHRGPLAHLLLVYPGRSLVPASWLERAAVAAAYAYAVVSPYAGSDAGAVAFGALLVGLAARRYGAAAGAERRARLTALLLALAFGGAVAAAGLTRLADAGVDRQVLWLYDAVVALVAAAVFADLAVARWSRPSVTGVVVDLGDPALSGTLRDRLARTLGDPTLLVGYWIADPGRYVDEAGRPLELPVADPQRALTPVEEDGRPLAVLVHDRALLDDPGLASAVASATRLAVANARLQAEVRDRVAEVAASRRRIVEAADEQRARLARELREGTERRLERVAALVAEIDPELERQLDDTRAELERLALGIQPRALAEDGLAGALRELAGRSPFPVAVVATSRRFPPTVEAAAWFTCSEALANATKHAQASRASIRADAVDGTLTVEVVDDGVGGADPSTGSGLRGLADRVEAIGGRLEVESPPGEGTRVVARFALSPSSSTAA